MKLYTLLNESGKVLGCANYEQQPENSTDKLCTENFAVAYFNQVTKTFYEGGTPEEIQKPIIASKQAEQLALAQTMALNNLIITQQKEVDPVTNLQNQAIFPFWDGKSKVYSLDMKCQAFDASNNVWLYKCVQAHTSQEDWKPYNTPALWTKVTPDGQVYKWVQPTGSQDAYKKGDRVWFPEVNTSKYESLIDANVWSPTAYPQGWKKI